jgi:hypothetical protein
MLTMRLNATVMRHASTSALMFGGARTTALLSEAMALAMRHELVMGTPSGVVYGCEPPVYVKAGDGCEVWIERIGLWRNAVVTSRSASSLWLWERTLCATAAPHAAPVAHRMRSHKRSPQPAPLLPFNEDNAVSSAWPFGLPQPVHASHPLAALNAPLLPLVMSWNAFVPMP